jgi:hypothetical protein
MEPSRPRWPLFQGFIAVLVAVLVLIAMVLTVVQGGRSVRATEENRELINTVREQTAIVLCVLLIEPEDRTPGDIAACHS